MIQEPQQESVMSQTWHSFVEIIFHKDYEVSKLAGAMPWLFWGLIMCNPWAQTFGSTPSYAAMKWLMPQESIWGMVCLMLVVNEFASALSTNRRWRMMASGMLFFWAVFVALMIGLVNPQGTGVGFYFGTGCVSSFAFWRSFRLPRE